MNHNEDGFAAAVSPTPAPRGGYGAAPPDSRVAIALAARRASGPPLTPEPLRPLTRKRCGAGGALPATPRGAQHQQSRSNPYKPSLYGSLENKLRRRVRE